MQGPQFASHRVSQSIRLGVVSAGTAKPSSADDPTRAEADGSPSESPLRARRKSNPDEVIDESDIEHASRSGRGSRWQTIKAKAIRHLA